MCFFFASFLWDDCNSFDSSVWKVKVLKFVWQNICLFLSLVNIRPDSFLQHLEFWALRFEEVTTMLRGELLHSTSLVFSLVFSVFHRGALLFNNSNHVLAFFLLKGTEEFPFHEHPPSLHGLPGSHDLFPPGSADLSFTTISLSKGPLAAMVLYHVPPPLYSNSVLSQSICTCHLSGEEISFPRSLLIWLPLIVLDSAALLPTKRNPPPHPESLSHEH